MDIVKFGNVEIQCKVAITENEIARGLMYVTSPVAMAFRLPASGIHKFWMKNTPLPLDIIFCQSGKIVAMEYGRPLSEEKVGPDISSDLVVELPYGMASQLGLAVGSPAKLVCSLSTLARRIEYSLGKHS